MDKIELVPWTDMPENGVRLRDCHLIPAHMRNFKGCILELEMGACAWQQIQAGCVAFF